MPVRYRIRQFWNAIKAVPAPEEIQKANQALSSPLMALFLEMQTSEQAHCLWIFNRLLEQDETNADLLAAALLHDVGKSCHPLRLWERVVAVLGKALLPTRVKSWGAGAPFGWKRAFVVAEQHPVWGAELAQRAGASPITVSLIRHHQANAGDLPRGRSAPQSRLEQRLLIRLKLLDDES